MYSKTVLALAVLGSASGFVTPSSKAVSVKSSPSALAAELNGVSGSTAPVPQFDPAGLAAKVDDAELQKYREAELKHGRVAMLAALGMVVQENFHPFFGTAGTDLGPAAFHLQQVDDNFPLLPAALIAVVAAVEGATINKGWSKQSYKEDGLGAGFVANLKSDYQPGDLGFDPLGLYPAEDSARTSIRNKELNNGRLAMIAIWGMWAQELVDGNTLGEHYALYGFGPATAAAGIQ